MKKKTTPQQKHTDPNSRVGRFNSVYQSDRELSGTAPKLAQMLARTIEQQITEEGWPVGKILGSEQDLILQFDVSRAVLRETVRILEHHNVAEMRRGPGGGLVICAPDVSAVATAAALYLNYRNVGPESLFNTRSAIELKCIDVAGAHITGEGILRLRETLAMEEASSGDEMLHGGHSIHLEIARLAGDPALELFLKTLISLQTELSPRRFDDRMSPNLARIRKSHTKIVEAIATGDLEQSRFHMRKHLEDITRRLAYEIRH